VTSESEFPRHTALAAHVHRAAQVARFVAVVLVTMVSVRFAIAGLQRALGVSEANLVDTSRSPAGAAAPPPSGSARAQVPGSSPRRPRERPQPSASAVAPTGRPLKITLGVSAGPPRSEVYVNGRRVGHTPFLGDTSCKSGLPLRIELVPPTGAPWTYERECRGDTLEITTPPP
jgi:hypothetical protein